MCLSFFYFSSPADAQMAEGYPKKFRLYGMIELSYRHFSMDAKDKNYQRKNSSWTFEQYYILNFDGYIYHPRLAVFNSYITFRDTMIKTSYTNPDFKNFGYYLSVNFLPYRPIALQVYLSENDYIGDTFPSGTQEIQISEYGAKFKSDYQGLPHLRIDYFNIGTTSGPYTSKTTAWSLNLYDSIAKLKTNWGIGFAVNNSESANNTYQSKYASFYTSTKIKSSASFANILNYYNTDSYNDLRFSSVLSFSPGERLNHNYQYFFDDAEYKFKAYEAAGIPSKVVATKTRQMIGSWGYRITTRMSVGLSMNYNLHEYNTRKWSSYAISPSLNYHRPVSRWVDFYSLYKFYLKEDEERGSFREHSFSTGIKIRRFNLGVIYVNYYFLRSYGVDKIRSQNQDETSADQIRKSVYDGTVHNFEIGIRGNFRGGAGNGYWNAQIVYQDIKIHRKRELDLSSEFDSNTSDVLEYSRNTKQTTFSADIFYPFRKGATLLFKTGYIDSQEMSQLFYEARLNYPLIRNVFLTAWLRDYYVKTANNAVSNTKTAELIMDYRIGRVYVNLNYHLERIEIKMSKTYNQRIFFRIRRSFG
jgi:hypothetical protein